MDRLLFAALAVFGLGTALFGLGVARVLRRRNWARGIFLGVGGILVALGVLGALGVVRAG